MSFKILTLIIPTAFTQFCVTGFSSGLNFGFSSVYQRSAQNDECTRTCRITHKGNKLLSTILPNSHPCSHLHLHSNEQQLPPNNELIDGQTKEQEKKAGAISMNVDDLAIELEGRGRARLVWDYYRIGVDPLTYFRRENAKGKRQHSSNQNGGKYQDNGEGGDSFEKFLNYIDDCERDDEGIQRALPTSRKTQGLGVNALKKLEALYEHGGLEGRTATLSFVSTSSDGTTKLLIKLADGLDVETVIIPWHDKGWSTVCISSQVGCRQGMYK